MLNTKLKKSMEHIRALEEKLRNAFNENAKFKVKQKEDEKLWKGLESKFSLTKTLCDQLTETLQLLAGQVQDAEKDKESLQVKLSANAVALDGLSQQMNDLSIKLESAEETIRNLPLWVCRYLLCNMIGQYIYIDSASIYRVNLLEVRRHSADLQGAVESENYALAAKLRDEISKLEAKSLAVSAKALAHENANYSFRLGQRVRHKIFGYRAIVCGMDPVCCESSSWMETAQVAKLSRGSNQPFYQVLVDVHADPNLLAAYVAEENLLAPDEPDLDRFDHPYISFLFYGMDAAGDFIPIKQLREKYNKPRREIPLDKEPGDDA